MWRHQRKADINGQISRHVFELFDAFTKSPFCQLRLVEKVFAKQYVIKQMSHDHLHNIQSMRWKDSYSGNRQVPGALGSDHPRTHIIPPLDSGLASTATDLTEDVSHQRMRCHTLNICINLLPHMHINLLRLSALGTFKKRYVNAIHY